MIQLPHHTCLLEKTIALTTCTFVSKVVSLFFNALSRLVIAFLPRSKRTLISWLQSPSAVILEPKEIKSVIASTFPPPFAIKRWDQTMTLNRNYLCLLQSHTFGNQTYIWERVVVVTVWSHFIKLHMWVHVCPQGHGKDNCQQWQMVISERWNLVF